MRLLGLDVETTGLDTANDVITELGWVVWDSDTKQPLAIQSHFLYEEEYEIKFSEETLKMMKNLCGITPQMLKEFGVKPPLALKELATLAVDYKVDYIVAHNGENYDKPLLFSNIERTGQHFPVFKDIPWLDTRYDIPFKTEPTSRSLRHLAADHDILNPFAHRAVFDVLTMLTVLGKYDLQEVIRYSQVPWITVRAIVMYDDRQAAKDNRFSWEKLGDKTYPKCWVKKIKKDQFELEKQKLGFGLVEI